ncbi:MAG: FecR family protein [Desulfobaccales bacterium]|nr:FecR family protein [Desulfobaccales bacterium]
MNMKMTGKRLGWWLTLGCCLVTFLAMSQSAPAQERKPAAEIIALVGTAEIKSPSDANFRPAKLKDALYPQDQIRTLANSRAKLFCADETILTLGESTTVDLAKFQMDQQGRRQSALVKILDGSMRFIVHKFTGPDPNFEIQGKTVVMGIRGTDGVFETRNPDNVYFFSGRTTLNLRNVTTGQIFILTPRNFATTEAGRPFRTGPVTPELQNRVLRNFQAAQSHIPDAVSKPPPPPPSLLSALRRAGIVFGNPAIPQTSGFLNTNNPTTTQGGTLQSTLPSSHQGLFPR